MHSFLVPLNLSVLAPLSDSHPTGTTKNNNNNNNNEWQTISKRQPTYRRHTYKQQVNTGLCQTKQSIMKNEGPSTDKICFTFKNAIPLSPPKKFKVSYPKKPIRSFAVNKQTNNPFSSFINTVPWRGQMVVICCYFLFCFACVLVLSSLDSLDTNAKAFIVQTNCNNIGQISNVLIVIYSDVISKTRILPFFIFFFVR